MRIDRVHTVLLKFAGNHIACDNYVIWLCNSCKKMAYVEAIAALAIVLWLNYVRLCWNHHADRRRREITHSITLLEVLDYGSALLPCPIIPSVCVLTSDCFVDGLIPSHPVQLGLHVRLSPKTDECSCLFRCPVRSSHLYKTFDNSEVCSRRQS